MTTERDLRLSIEAVGPLLPVLMWGGRVVDGEKRERICLSLGLVPRVVRLGSLGEACSALWVLHPKRALELAADSGAASLHEIAELCSARVSDVALALSSTRKKKTDKRSPRRTRSVKTSQLHVYLQPQLKHYLRLVGEQQRLDNSSVIRIALWEYIQQHLPRAAFADSRRGPALEWVKPVERRRSRRSMSMVRSS